MNINSILEFILSFSLIVSIAEITGQNELIIALIFMFICIDFASGVWAGHMNGNFDWHILWLGMIKKSIYPIVILFSMCVAMLLSSQLEPFIGADMDIYKYIVPIVLTLLASIEITSIFANLRRGGFPIPNILEVLENIFKGKME